MKRKYKIAITQRIPKDLLDNLKSNFEITANLKNRPLTRDELKKMVKNVDAILCFINDRIDKEIISIAGGSLKIISTFSTGFEHIDIVEATKRGIKIGYTGNILTETTADLTFGLILSIGRRIVEADKFVRENRWKYGWNPELMMGMDINNKTLGLIGMGNIGKALAKRALGFNMKILYNKRNIVDDFKKDDFKDIEFCDLQKLLSESDYIAICCSLNESSFHLIDYEKIKIMKNTSFLINTARGKIINEKDLIQGLKNKKIAGAALDVFEYEPIRKNNPLLKMKNVILLPHIGSASLETRRKMAEVAISNIINIFEGKEKEALLVN